VPRPAIHAGFWPVDDRAIRHCGREPELEELRAVAS
jgi:hypothetical protein